MYLSGLIPEPLTAYDDTKLLNYGIGFTNIVARTTRGSADLTRFVNSHLIGPPVTEHCYLAFYWSVRCELRY